MTILYCIEELLVLGGLGKNFRNKYCQYCQVSLVIVLHLPKVGLSKLDGFSPLFGGIILR